MDNAQKRLDDKLDAIRHPGPVERSESGGAAEHAPMTTDEAREYLVKFMEQHFTDKTFHRYIRGQIGGSGPLAGDFAWQMARALRMLGAPASADNPSTAGAEPGYRVLKPGVTVVATGISVSGAAPVAQSTAGAELEALRQENDKLREALGDSALAATMLHKLSVENGGINAVYSGGAAQILAEALGQQFIESGAENYLEVGFNTNTGVRLLVTLQRCDGKTPANFRAEAEEKLAAALAELRLMRTAGAAKSTLDKICDIFGIGALTRDEATILANVRNVIRREACLSAIERKFFMAPLPPDDDDPDDDPGATCMLNWGESPEKYVETFGEAMNVVAAPAAQAPMPQWISVEDRLPEGICIACYMPHLRGHKPRIIRAVYFRQYQVEASGEDGEDTEYNEANDTDYIKAGWYERIDNWGDFSSVAVCEGTVTHWMTLPAAPEQSALGEKGGE